MSAPNRKRMAWTAAISAAIVFGMTGLAFAAVPLYKAFCQATGYGGQIPVSRVITLTGVATLVLAPLFI